MNSASGFVDSSGVVETESGEGYEPRGVRVNSREQVTPDDVSFWVNKVLAPKYGLDNLNANNVASFLKELEVNWVKLPVELKDKVVNLMVEQIFPMNYEFKDAVLSRIIPQSSSSETPIEVVDSNESIKEGFGISQVAKLDKKYIIIAIIVAVVATGMYSGVIPNPFTKKPVKTIPM
jgi:hypothetical protein